MNKEILLVVDAVSNEKGVEKDIIFSAIEAALEMATKKRYHNDVNIRVAIDRETGDYETFRRWEVVDDESMDMPERQTTLSAAQFEDPNTNLGDFIEEQVESIEFGRIAAQTAKQVIIQRIREAEKNEAFDEFSQKQGTIITGIVQRREYGGRPGSGHRHPG